ncbi:MAG: flagellar basal-body rod protein FlgF [Hafnia sp.]|uniref:Flagellar basal-body rod protein FlgF n=1 Tax=Obesumbacterium proteus ATCC 12841 TaxID=1354268 RepID=A0AA91EFU8_9GAMM|nr:flagellar basal-body rod protein FlgF [Obesumbacterium proteus]MDN5987500.1 flagellar basal-body rod protein FlgF [Hafniaceae bacterium]MDN6072328.1 flagellar basal-body rod protein FlgF [Enterobacterales bacterium]AMO80250.1 flagellar biosynthesis protein FlgF [Obesumbacterium proteus]KKI46320.1 flagellar basal body rod protein FlgF [Obesumbacterium proteus]MCE9885408.1 flagellar basal-body rod protein FlgF [Obesumbacterium proteus]
MDHLIYTAVSGANRSLSQQQIHSNNLANVNTSGFRGDLESALSQQVMGSGYDSRYLVQGQNSGVDMTPGAVRDTGRELDIAIKGNGLIAVGNGNREVYTRNGQMDVSPDGDLTINGRPVIGETGPVVLPPFSDLSIGDDGTITIVPQDGDVNAAMDVDRIKLVDIPADQLSKDADGLLVSTTRNNPRSDAVEIAAGHLESSNISAISEMVSSIALNRQFEAQIKMMKAAEDLATAGNRLIRGS